MWTLNIMVLCRSAHLNLCRWIIHSTHTPWLCVHVSKKQAQTSTDTVNNKQQDRELAWLTDWLIRNTEQRFEQPTQDRFIIETLDYCSCLDVWEPIVAMDCITMLHFQQFPRASAGKKVFCSRSVFCIISWWLWTGTICSWWLHFNFNGGFEMNSVRSLDLTETIKELRHSVRWDSEIKPVMSNQSSQRVWLTTEKRRQRGFLVGKTFHWAKQQANQQAALVAILNVVLRFPETKTDLSPVSGLLRVLAVWILTSSSAERPCMPDRNWTKLTSTTKWHVIAHKRSLGERSPAIQTNRYMKTTKSVKFTQEVWYRQTLEAPAFVKKSSFCQYFPVNASRHCVVTGSRIVPFVG